MAQNMRSYQYDGQSDSHPLTAPIPNPPASLPYSRLPLQRHRGFAMRSLSLALFLFLTPTIAFAQATQVRKSPPENAEINSSMQRFVDAGDIAGAVTLVGHQGKIVHLGAIGLADIDSDRAMKKSNLFSIASMTKPIVSTAVMILQDEGKLSFDDKVSKYIPAFADVKLESGEAPSREITIRDCVTHTAGLAGEQIFKGSLENAVNELAKRPLAFRPEKNGSTVRGSMLPVASWRSWPSSR